MTKFKVFASLLAGLGFVSLLCLSINIPILGLFLSLLFAPGAIVMTVAKLDSYIVLLVVNFAIYSLLAFCVILFRLRSLPEEEFKRFTVRMLLPVVAVSTLACFPTLNPMLPLGMAELADQERELEQALIPSMNLQEVRSILEKKNIDFGEQVQKTAKVLSQSPGKQIDASPGDIVVTGHWETSAWSFPCGYHMLIVLLFGPDEKLKDHYICRLPRCP
jgi:hypothetical protein